MTEIYTTKQWMQHLVAWMKEEDIEIFRHADLPDHLKLNTWFRRATAADYLRVVSIDRGIKTKTWKVNSYFWHQVDTFK